MNASQRIEPPYKVTELGNQEARNKYIARHMKPSWSWEGSGLRARAIYRCEHTPNIPVRVSMVGGSREPIFKYHLPIINELVCKTINFLINKFTY